VPELPDVERFRRAFARRAAGRTVAAVWADPTILRNTTVEELGRALVGRRFEEPERRGKWLVAWTDGAALLLHFGMTGDVVWSGDEPERHRHDRLAMTFVDGGELRYRNMRKLGGVWLAHGPGEVGAILGRVGPDALEISRVAFLGRLARRRGGVKAALMDQSFVAGVGNILADEILWQVRLHPKTPIQALRPREREALSERMQAVLHEAVDRYDDIADEPSWLWHVRGLPGAACPRCGTPLERTTAAGRTTYFCPRCQPLRFEPRRPARR
jgi:formamidopyrimidine-DNA glycosylase